MSGNTVVTFGEIMLRVTPESLGERLGSAVCWRLEPGGAESNIAIALARLGVASRHVTALPEGPLGDRVLDTLQSTGVDTGYIVRSSGRMGLYFTELGCGPRAPRVLYDRMGSSFSQTMSEGYDLVGATKSAGHVHVSGICLALGEAPAKAARAFVDSRSSDATFSVDLNYRSTLWEGRQEECEAAMWALCEGADTIFANESDLRNALGLDVPTGGDLRSWEPATEECFRRLPGLKMIVVTVRETISATHHRFGAVLFKREIGREPAAVAKAVDIDNVVDRLGTGDAFDAGFIFGTMHGFADKECLDLGVGLSSLNHTTFGDGSQFGREDLEEFLGSGSTRVRR